MFEYKDAGHPTTVSRVGRILRKAAALVTLTLLTAWLVWIWSGGRLCPVASDFYDATMRARQAVALGVQPCPSDQRMLVRLLPDPATREAFLRDPFAVDSWARIDHLLAEHLARKAGPEAPRLMWPRAAVADLRPSFEFMVPDSQLPQRRYRLTLMAQGIPEQRYLIRENPDPVGKLTFRLPPGQFLEIGRCYAWKVELEPAQDADRVSSYGPDTATFRVMDPESRTNLLDVPSTGSDIMDRLVHASSLNAHGLARDSLVELADFPISATTVEIAFCKFLQAEAWAMLGEWVVYDRLRQEVIHQPAPPPVTR